jgi:DNA-directed RNA polymerase specialized sigma24 family protein
MRSPPTIWFRIASPARLPSSTCGRKGRTCGLGFLRSCTINTSIRSASLVRQGELANLSEAHRSLSHAPAQGHSLELRDLDRALAQLPDEQRTVILMVGLEGMSYEAVAEIVGVPVGTVRSRLSRGREALRHLMGIIPDSRAEAIMARQSMKERARDAHIAA